MMLTLEKEVGIVSWLSSVKFFLAVIVVNWYISGISCYFTDPTTKNFQHYGSLDPYSHSHKKSEGGPTATSWDTVNSRIFFLTSPPYQIRLRHEERKGLPFSSSSDFNFRDTGSGSLSHHQDLLQPFSSAVHNGRYTNGPNRLTTNWKHSGSGYDYVQNLQDAPKKHFHSMFPDQMLEGLESKESNENFGGKDAPLYAPLISAHVLSNMEMFFEHLKENLKAIQTASEENSLVENTRLQQEISQADSPLLDRNYLGEVKQSKKLQLRSSMDTVASSKTRWHPPVTRFYKDSKPTFPFHLRGSDSHLLLTRRIDPTKVVDIAQSKSKSSHTLNFNQPSAYDPSWSWTNLGLGK